LSKPDYAAARILEQWRRMGVLPEKLVVLLLDSSWGAPLAQADNISVREAGNGLHVVTAEHGYMREPDVPLILRRAVAQHGLAIDPDQVFYMLAQELVLTCPPRLMPRWQRMLFGFLSRNTLPGPDYLSIPTERMVVFNWMLRV
jgi:KUP system potassium uptake protein